LLLDNLEDKKNNPDHADNGTRFSCEDDFFSIQASPSIPSMLE